MSQKRNTAGPRGRPASALTVAGSDSGGGAGIQTDLRTFAALGVHGTSVVTALTAQNTRGVAAVHLPPRAFLRAQFAAVLDDFAIGAAKIGMVATPALARELARALARRRLPIVLDPVLVATSGARLARDDLAEALLRHLFPLAAVVTPNLPEAERLLSRRIRNARDMREAARDLVAAGANAVLLKGGHLAGAGVRDLLLADGVEHWFAHRRVAGEFHGTGCTLSAAIAARLALGDDLAAATAAAVAFVHRALRAGYRPGKGRLQVLDVLAAAR